MRLAIKIILQYDKFPKYVLIKIMIGNYDCPKRSVQVFAIKFILQFDRFPRYVVNQIMIGNYDCPKRSVHVF